MKPKSLSQHFFNPAASRANLAKGEKETLLAFRAVHKASEKAAHSNED
jgi:hypothetical protein